MPAKENAAEQQQQSQLAAMRSELGEMRRFVRSLLALELAKRTLAVVRVQAGWRAARDRRGVVARAFRARRRLRVLVSTWLLHVSVPAPAGSAALRARLHALGRGFLVRRRLRRYLAQHQAARRLQATTRGGRARRAWRLALVQARARSPLAPPSLCPHRPLTVPLPGHARSTAARCASRRNWRPSGERGACTRRCFAPSSSGWSGSSTRTLLQRRQRPRRPPLRHRRRRRCWRARQARPRWCDGFSFFAPYVFLSSLRPSSERLATHEHRGTVRTPPRSQGVIPRFLSVRQPRGAISQT